MFEHRQSDASVLVLMVPPVHCVERVESYKYLGFVLHATKSNDIWGILFGGSCHKGNACYATSFDRIF